MKSGFELSVIAAAALLAAATLYLIHTDDGRPGTFGYESIEYDDLVSRNARLGLYAVPDDYERPACFSVSGANATHPLDFLSDAVSVYAPIPSPEDSTPPPLGLLSWNIEESSNLSQPIDPVLLDLLFWHMEKTSGIGRGAQFSDAPEFYTGLDTDVKTSLALEVIERYGFDAVRIATDNNPQQIPDAMYRFDCPFEYEGGKAVLRVMFEPHFWDDAPAYVNVTRNDAGLPVLTDDDIRVFDGGINSTVLFYNDLGREITIRSTDPAHYQRTEDDRYYLSQEPERLFENSFAKDTNEDEIRIPPGKAFSHRFSSWHTPHDTPLNYTITPPNLRGTVTVTPYYDCAPSQDIFLPYAKVHRVPEPPSYLPPGYGYECGFYHYPEAATYYYANGTQSAEFKGRLGHGTNPEFLASGGLAVRLADVKPYGYPPREHESDKFTRMAERFPANSMTAYVNGHPAVLEKERYGDDIFGRLTIYLDYDTWYVIEGGMVFSELYRIAESIPLGEGDGPSSVPDTLADPFEGKPLMVRISDLGEIYRPGQPISFDIQTQGSLHDVGSLHVTITDSAGGTVWQSPPTVGVGGAKIGYVDYTWSAGYDFEAPIIRDPGRYEMTASWDGVTAQHKFQVRKEPQFSLLQDMVPERAHGEALLLSFGNDCSRQVTGQGFAAAGAGTEEAKNSLKQNNDLLGLVFERQEAVINDEKRTRSYTVPSQVIDCIENIRNDSVRLAEGLERAGETLDVDMLLLLRESEVLFHGHEYDRALQAADFVLENLDGDNPDAMLVKGKSLSRMGENEGAIKAYEEVVETNPDLAEAWSRLGYALSVEGMHQRAIQSFDQAIRADPNHADAYVGKAFTLMILERYDEALENVEEAVRIKPDVLAYREIHRSLLDFSKYV